MSDHLYLRQFNMLPTFLIVLLYVGMKPTVWAQDWNTPIDAPNPMKRGDTHFG